MRRIGIRYRFGEYARDIYRQNFLAALETVADAEGPRTRYIAVGSTCSPRRISMFRNSAGIHSLSHLRLFYPSMPLFPRAPLRFSPVKSFTFFPRNLVVFPFFVFFLSFFCTRAARYPLLQIYNARNGDDRGEMKIKFRDFVHIELHSRTTSGRQWTFRGKRSFAIHFRL